MKKEDINVFPFDPTEYPFNIEVCGITECDKPYKTTNNPCRNYIFEYVVKGRGLLYYNNKTYYPQQGDAYILHKGSNNTYYPDKDDPWTKLWFNVDGLFVVNSLMAYKLMDTVLIEGFGEERLFREIYEITSSNRPIEDIMNDVSLKFVEILQRAYQIENHAVLKNHANIIKRILDSNIYNKDFTMKDICDQLYLSQAQVINLFKAQYNQTPYRYYIEQRIQIAATMLLNSQLSVQDIAESLHFADAHYFSNMFKKVMGLSPQQYRKQYQRIYTEMSNLNLKKH